MKLINQSNQIISASTSLDDVINILAKNRGIKDINQFINPPFPDLDINPKSTVLLINKHLKDHKNILIYGDYDVDGITSTALLWLAMSGKSSNVFPYIPDRGIDGYGFRAKSFFRIQQEQNKVFDLLITVDNGIVATSEFHELLSKQNINIVIVDHHLPGDIPPPTKHIIHSTEICGAALSWFLAKHFDPNSDLGLAALATVSDCQPLLGINRAIVYHGLQSLIVNPSPGIKQLISVSGLKPEYLRAYELGFVLGPRINAIGRLSNPTDALRLLCSQNSLQAKKYAQILSDFNRNRQELQKESLDLVTKNLDLSHRLLFNVGEFNPGVIGLIAGRLTDNYHLPSIVIATNGDICKGSCRSISEFNIINSLRQFENLFIDLGGHPGAAGFTIYSSNIEKLKRAILKLADRKLKQLSPEKNIYVDAEMELNFVTVKNYQFLRQFEPFGIDNPEPSFLFKNIPVTSKKIIGSNGEHLKLKLGNIEAIAFKKGEFYDQISDKISFVAQLSVNTWNNMTTPQLIVKEII